MMVALDASALLALLFHEQGHERVAKVVKGSCISAVNLSEVIGRVMRAGVAAGEVYANIAALGVEFVPFTARDATAAATLLPLTKPLGLSLADRACLTLAASRAIPALTADRAWLRLQTRVKVETIR